MSRFVFLAIALVCFCAQAQTPGRPIRMLVPVVAGGGPDLAARIIGPRLSDLLGSPVVVENRGGANGNIAGQMTAQSSPDGQTLLLSTDSLIVINRALYRNMGFDPLKDLAPIATVTANEFVLTVNRSVPAKTLAEFVDYAKKAPKPLPYASAGSGSQHHLLMEMLKVRAGINLLHVPYKGGAQGVAATVAGDTVVTFSGGASSAPHVKAGTLRALAGSGTQRSAAYPDVPTVAETYPGYEGIIWSGLFAAAGTPEAHVSRLRSDLYKVLAEPAVIEGLARSGGLRPYVTTAAQFAEVIRRDSEKYAEVVSRIGLTLD